MKYLLMFALLLTGCSKAKEVVGLGPTAEEVLAEKEKEQAALNAQRERELQKLKDGDALVARWAEKIESSTTGNGFKRTEGLTEVDPWGHPIKVEYRQEWFKEIATIRSSGPDEKFDTQDDLVRTRTTSNILGVLDGISGFGWLVIVWLGCGLLALLFSSGVSHHRAAKGKSKHHRRPVLFVIATLLLAPLAMLIYGLQFIGGALGAGGDFFDGFEFDFDIDIDL